MGLCAEELRGNGAACELASGHGQEPHVGAHVTWPCQREPGDPPRLPIPSCRPVSTARMSAIRAGPTTKED
jgi:hypothetical protein